jgi:hypothetical protein
MTFPVDVFPACRVQNLLPVNRRVEAPIEALQGLGCIRHGLSHSYGQLRSGAPLGLITTLRAL